MNSSMSGWSTSRMPIFAARRVLPPDLMVPAMASAPRMKETGPEARPPAVSRSFDERSFERVIPAPEPPSKRWLPLRPVPLQDGVHGVVDGEDEAGGALGLLFDAEVEPDGGVEAGLLVDQDVLQLGVERLRLVFVQEVAALAAPVRDAVDDAVDELPDGALPDGGGLAGGGGGGLRQGAAEVLGGDDVGGVLRPGRGELNVSLLEDGDAVGACDDRRAVVLPRYLIVGVDAFAGELAGDDPPARRGWGGGWSGVECHAASSRCRCNGAIQVRK